MTETQPAEAAIPAMSAVEGALASLKKKDEPTPQIDRGAKPKGYFATLSATHLQETAGVQQYRF